MRKPEYHDTLTEAQKIGLRFIDQLPESVTRAQAETVLVSHMVMYTPLLYLSWQDFIRENISSKFEVYLGGS